MEKLQAQEAQISPQSTPVKPESITTKERSIQTNLAVLGVLAGISIFTPNNAEASKGKTAIGEAGYRVEQLHLSNTVSQTGGYFVRATKAKNATHSETYSIQGIDIHGEHFNVGLGAKIPLSTNDSTQRLGGNLTLGYHGTRLGVHHSSVVDSQQWRSETSFQFQLPNHSEVGPVAIAEGHFGHTPKVFGGICASAEINQHISAEVCAATTKNLDGHASINLTYR